MKQGFLVVVILGAAWGAQAQTGSRGSAVVPVSVVDGQVRVAPTRAQFSAGVPTITWMLQTSGFRFTAQSINFGDMAGFFRCATFNEGQGVRCTRSPDAPSGSGSYTVSVQSASQPAQESDPGVFIMNE